jgi:acetoacetyl-CoA synthetase
MDWVNQKMGTRFHSYEELWDWSVNNTEEFWSGLMEYFGILNDHPVSAVLDGREMPDITWFKGARINFAEHVFRHATSSRPAIVFAHESGLRKEISWKELTHDVGAFQAYLKARGCQEGDSMAAYLPNIPEATTAFLAANSIGMIWSSCSPDFGSDAVIDRFAQISPKVFVTVDGYTYGGKGFDKTSEVKSILEKLPSVELIITIPYLNSGNPIPDATPISEVLEMPSEQLVFHRTDFSAPIWVLFSSGTTGIPKAITHSSGGILLEMLKYLTFHNNVKAGDRSFWYTTTGWMMWNYLHGALLCGASIVLYDGSAAHPSTDQLFRLIESCKITHMGTSAGYIVANMKAGTKPGDYDLSSLQSIGSTGSPLPAEGFEWIYKNVGSDIWLTSISGGTDVCSAFVGGCPTRPVYSGEIQCRALGCDLHAFDEAGNTVIDEVGEMVISSPMPSMPIYFWNDPDKQRYRSSYFTHYPGVWRHGDWIRITSRDGVVIYGRSDATLNRGGIRIGTSEIYRAVNSVEEIADSLIICLEKDGGEFYMPLFVVPRPGITLTDELRKKISTTIRNAYTPRHVPDEIIAIGEVPYTISGKKTETPVKKILMGQKVADVIKPDALKNPEALKYFVEFSKSIT